MDPLERRHRDQITLRLSFTGLYYGGITTNLTALPESGWTFGFGPSTTTPSCRR